ncbi:MAG: hypothetical protein LBS43_11665 [Prevotellaceae bacterium]|jgi:hypothetical protein|nr:hypothetical protein [Prevotellaceae bacterium]
MVVVVVLFVILVVLFYFTTKGIVSKMREEDKKLGVKYKLVSAGSIKKRRTAVVWLEDGYEEESFVLDGESINKSEYTAFVVDGKSMRKFGIESGDVVFVTEEKNPPINKTSIFVLNVYPKQRGKIEYKLRKPVDFYDCQDDSADKFDAWVAQHPELDADKCKQLYAEAEVKGKIAECKHLGCRLLVSETTRKRKVHYSFHPENRIFGKVEYLIPNDNVEIIEKK